MTKVSIIIPYHKDRGYLNQAIESVKAQSYECELILSHSNGTCAINLANGLDKVQTEFYAVLAEDDWLSVDFAKRMLEKIGDADLCYGYAWRHKGSGKPELWRSSYSGLNDLLNGTRIHGGAVLYRTESVRRVGGYERALETAEEYDLHLRMSKENCKFVESDFPHYHYLMHEENKSVKSGRFKRERNEYINQVIRNRYR